MFRGFYAIAIGCLVLPRAKLLGVLEGKEESSGCRLRFGARLLVPSGGFAIGCAKGAVQSRPMGAPAISKVLATGRLRALWSGCWCRAYCWLVVWKIPRYPWHFLT